MNGNGPIMERRNLSYKRGQKCKAGARLPLQQAVRQSKPLRGLYSNGQADKEQKPQKLTWEVFQARWFNGSLQSLGTDPRNLLFTPCTLDIKYYSNSETVILQNLHPKPQF